MKHYGRVILKRKTEIPLVACYAVVVLDPTSPQNNESSSFHNVTYKRFSFRSVNRQHNGVAFRVGHVEC